MTSEVGGELATGSKRSRRRCAGVLIKITYVKFHIFALSFKNLKNMKKTRKKKNVFERQNYFFPS